MWVAILLAMRCQVFNKLVEDLFKVFESSRHIESALAGGVRVSREEIVHKPNPNGKLLLWDPSSDNCVYNCGDIYYYSSRLPKF